MALITEVYFLSFGTLKSKIKALAGLGFFQASLFGLCGLSSCCVLTWPFLWAYASLVSLCVSQFPLLLRTSVHQGPPKMTSFYLHRLFIGLISKCSHILRYWRVRGHNSGHNSILKINCNEESEAISINFNSCALKSIFFILHFNESVTYSCFRNIIHWPFRKYWLIELYRSF